MTHLAMARVQDYVFGAMSRKIPVFYDSLVQSISVSTGMQSVKSCFLVLQHSQSLV